MYSSTYATFPHYKPVSCFTSAKTLTGWRVLLPRSSSITKTGHVSVLCRTQPPSPCRKRVNAPMLTFDLQLSTIDATMPFSSHHKPPACNIALKQRLVMHTLLLPRHDSAAHGIRFARCCLRRTMLQLVRRFPSRLLQAMAKCLVRVLNTDLSQR
jgi:hypothetical protein